jgi:hypothetical protein
MNRLYLLALLTTILLVPVTEIYAVEKIVFSHDENGDKDIWIMNPDGSNAQPLLVQPGSNETVPKISYDGTRIAFLSNTQGTSLWIMNADGSNDHSIISAQDLFPNAIIHSGPSWFPQDSLIAYAVRDGCCSGLVIYGIRPDGTGNHVLIDSENNLDYCPDVDPVNGCLVVHKSDPGDWGPTADTRVTNICTGEHYTLIEGSAYRGGGWQSWSPDGSRIAHEWLMGPGALYPPVNLFMIDADGSDLTQITFATGDTVYSGVNWSPDGSQLVCHFTADGWEGRYSLYMMNADGSNPHELYLSETSSLTYPNWGDIPLYLCGNLTGTLSNAYSPYSAECDLLVPAGDTLSIEPGVVLNFRGPYKLEVQGTLLAVGTREDSIVFTTDTLVNPDRWRGIRFFSADDRCTLSYCAIENGWTSPDWYWPACSGGGVYCSNSSPRFSHCSIRNNRSCGGGGIACENSSSPSFTDCAIYGNVSEVSTGGGIYCGNLAAPTFLRCIVSSNYAWGGGGMYFNYSNPTVQNCTFVYNAAQEGGFWGGGICCDGYAGTISNCVVANSGGSGIAFPNGPDAVVAYCDLYGNEGGTFGGQFGSYGQIVTTNHNGDPCDQYYNILLDPIFVNSGAGDFHLTANSPCIDAGDSTSLLDPDCTPADIGAFYFFHLPQPEDLVAQQQGWDMLLRWSIVDSTECGHPTPIQSYVVFFKQVFDESWNFLAATPDTFYVHADVIRFAPAMYYEIVATDIDIGRLNAIAHRGMAKEEFDIALARVEAH